MNGLSKTIFFSACRGVFAGGGCRAAAHVGAFEAAIMSGVNFSEVAGTSAGSIIAALVGAGASPDFVSKHCGSLVFSKLLCKPLGGSIKSGLFGRILKTIPLLDRSMYGRIAIYGGAYSSTAIEDWVDERLSELIPDAPRPVKFKSLSLPTTIVATALAEGRPKIWSTATTPDESVALAVRCSCSIPFFFEPVAVGNNRFVDGGLLSNLPAFVFDETRSFGSLGGRILGFSLKDDWKPPAEWHHKEMLRSLVGTIIGGATELQTSMQPGVNIIFIPTGSVQATDFDISDDQIAMLIENGRQSVFNFIRNEALHLQSERDVAIWHRDEDNFLAELTKEARMPGMDLLALSTDTLWFWKLFPTVLAWLEFGSSLRVLVEPPHGTQDNINRELQRRKNLTDLGATVVERTDLPFYGFLLMRLDDHRESAFILNPSKTEHASYGTAYIGTHHRPILNILKNSLHSVFKQVSGGTEKCWLQTYHSDEITARLKSGVWQYGKKGITITLEKVPLNRVQMLVRRVRTFKFVQISHLGDLYNKYSIDFFKPVVITTNEKITSIITPPVFEEWGENMIAIEGNTRLYYLYKEGFKEIYALVVRGVQEPLPGQPVWPSQAILYTRPIDSSERIAGFNYGQFRSIEGAVRPFIT